MKVKQIVALLLTAAMGAAIVAQSGCSLTSDGEKDPATIIQDAYGNEQFTISFSSEGLDEPLADVYYTASSIPKLPTPERVGYIFAGWYFDSALTQPYEDEYLLIKMCDLTLYAKWIEESMDANGTYAIEFDAYIVEGSVTLGTLTQAMGGYDDFSDAIVEDETYIEKTDDAVQLKLTYDSGVNVPFLSTAVYTVSIANQSANDAYVSERITAETDTQKTVFINIDNFDISDTLYLSVQWINYRDDSLTSEERSQTTTYYTVAFDITRFIGFERSYADTSGTLEDGYYLVRSYFRLIDNSETMLETFNPVYSYLYAEDGNYTLIKPFAAYPYGEITSAEGVTAEQLYSRYTNYYKVLAGYDAAIPDDEEVGTDSSTENMIENWDLGYYREISYEFHADTGQCYYVIDMGDDYKSEIILQSTSTAMGVGLSEKRLRIEYDCMIPLDDSAVDYTPLEGDSFVYASSSQSYAFDTSDLTTGDSMYSYMQAYGLFTNLINFYFSSNSNTVNIDTNGGTIYDTKITVTPTGVAASTSVADMRYNIAEFNVVSYIYGYDATDQNLCVDGVGVQTFGSGGRRTRTRVRVGKSVEVGEAVSLQSLYTEKVDPYLSDFGQVSWQAYKMDGDSVDFSSPVTVARTFTFEEDVAILFTLTSGGSTQTSLVELRTAQQPSVTVVDGTYDEGAQYTVGDVVTLPRITYTWYGKEESYVYNYFPSVEDYVADVDILTVAIFEISESGTYTLVYRNSDIEDSPTGQFKITAEDMLVVYEMSNYYGEREYYVFEFSSYASPEYTLIDGEGNELANDKLDYADGEREILELEAEDGLLEGIADLEAALSTDYILVLPEDELTFALQSYGVYTADIAVTVSVSDYTAAALAEEIFAKIGNSGYAYIALTYATDEGDIYTADYLYNVSFSGMADIGYILSYEDYFTDTQYVFTSPQLVSSGGVQIGSGSLTLYYFNGSEYAGLSTSSSRRDIIEYENLGSSYVITFLRSGSYRIRVHCSMNYDSNGNRVFADGENRAVVYYIDFEVYDYNTDLKITYFTDADHPFSDELSLFAEEVYEDGELIGYTYTPDSFSLASGNPITLGSSSFASVSDGSVLYAWGRYSDTRYTESSRLYRLGTVISDFIGEFNARNVTLYAMWDYGVTVTVTDYAGTPVSESTLYLENTYSNSVNFEYTLELSAYTAPSRSGYSHTGWLVVQDGVSSGYGTEDEVEITGDVQITPVYAKLLTIVYNTDNPETDIVESRMNISRSTDILAGSVLGDVLTTAKLQQLSSVTITNSDIADTWEFKYWAVYIDGVLTEIDLYSTEIDGDWAEESTSGSTTTFTLNLYAVYGPIGE